VETLIVHKKETYNLAIGLTLQELHAERKMPREKIAEALEISELAVTRVEHGAEMMTAGSLVLLLDLFDVSWDDFLRRVKSHLDEAEAQIR
jgi:transcriptional regulator with XRE-family HTH domain